MPKDNIKIEKGLIDKIVIVPLYEPPSNIHPATAGCLIDKKIRKREFYATLFNAIINGHIVIDERIENNKYKYYLLKNKGFKKSISCDRLIYSHIFKNSDIIAFENIIFETDIILDHIKDKLIKLNYFENPFYILELSQEEIENQKREKGKWIESIERSGFLGSKFLASIFFTKREQESKKINNAKNIVAVKEYFKNLRTKSTKKLKAGYKEDDIIYTQLGAKERAKWLGFKDYLQTAERFRLDIEQVETFSKYLPYAIALGVETKWAKRFENMDVNRLEWFHSQKSESIRRHDSQKVYFKHLINFLGQIYVK